MNDSTMVAQAVPDRDAELSVLEDAASLAILWSVGVNYIQGYFLQEPEATLSYDFSDEVA